MTHLKIEQNNGVIEEVGSNIIKTLYDIAIGIRINKNGKIYVPDQSIADYKAASNWSSLSSKIVGISQL